MPARARLIASEGALLVVDLQTRLVPSIRGADRLVSRAGQLIRGAALLGVPTFATEQVPSKLGPTVDPLAELLPDRLAKSTFHALGAPGLGDRLAVARVRHVTLIGIETHICIAQTALELLGRGWAVQVAVDAVGTRFADDHETALRRLGHAGVVLTTVEAALFEWAESADHPQFRALSALVKEER